MTERRHDRDDDEDDAPCDRDQQQPEPDVDAEALPVAAEKLINPTSVVSPGESAAQMPEIK
jgi:hypothetical protein